MKELFISNKFSLALVGILTILTFLFSYKDYKAEVSWENEVKDTKINNYLIFSNAFNTLKDKGNLYVLHPSKHYDLYKYSPTFAFLMAPFAIMPDFLGLLSWNWLNLFIFLFAIKSLPGLNKKAILIIVFVSVMELIGSIQNEQSNGLMSALVILFLSFMERNKPIYAIGFLMISVYIKLFSLVFFVMLIMYPGFYKNILYTILWAVFLFFLPALSTGLDYLFLSYERWLVLLQNDHSNSLGYSVMGIFYSWFGVELNKIFLVIGGMGASLIPLLRTKEYSSSTFRYSFAALLLIWVVIFNHKAESPLFVIAMTGVGLWYVVSEKSKINLALLLLAFFMVSIAFSDLMPSSLKDNIFHKYSLKALPCLIIWGKIIFDLLKPRYQYDSK